MPPSERTHVYSPPTSAELRPFVKRILAIEHRIALEDVHLPEPGFFVAVTFAGGLSLADGAAVPHVALTGIGDRPRAHRHQRGHGVVVAALTPAGAAALVRQPLEEFFNATVDLRDVLETRDAQVLGALDARLGEAPNAARRVALVEAALQARFAAARPDPLVAAATDEIERAPETARVDALARKIGLSQSALERRFRKQVGVTPRTYASLVRLQRVARLRDSGADLTTIAHAAGYFDQAHFSRDFRRFAGVPPSRFFAPAG